MATSPGAKAVLIFGQQFSPKQQHLYLEPFPRENWPTPGEGSCSSTADYCIQKETRDTFLLDTEDSEEHSQGLLALTEVVGTLQNMFSIL